MLLQDFNYFLNKAIKQYVNKRYNVYDVNQQTTDDLRVLKQTVYLDITKIDGEFDTIYETTLPDDYLHLLNCICIFTVKKNFKCYKAGDYVKFAAKKLTADSQPMIMSNYYNRPIPQRPYFYINNSDNPSDSSESTVTVQSQLNNNTPNSIQLNSLNLITRDLEVAQSLIPKARMEILCGSDNSVFGLSKVFVGYLKSPQTITLTQEQVNLIEDTSQIMEFPDYVCQEIINELTMLVMENTTDPRLQTNPIVTQSIAKPAQQQTK